jgi:hypothetical protein
MTMCGLIEVNLGWPRHGKPETSQIDPFTICNSPKKRGEEKLIHSRNVHVGILDGRIEKYISSCRN